MARMNDQQRNRKWQEQQRNRVNNKKKKASVSSSKQASRSASEALDAMAENARGASASFRISIGGPSLATGKEILQTMHMMKKEKQEKAKKALDRLSALPGMQSVKGQIEEMIALNKINEKRRNMGLKTEFQSLHMVFAGEPGTGKTTAARLIGEAFIHMGMLKTNQDIPPFVEVHHDDIESRYVGGAEENMKRKFEEARGGVLFIDEVYAFAGPHHYHKTLLANLVSMIEDMRDEVLVIVAGYHDEVQDFLDANPGIRSRFSNFIEFPRYEMETLQQIADLMAKDRDYSLNASYHMHLRDRLKKEMELDTFGNGRTVRNILEHSIRLHSLRMVGIDNPSKDQLMCLTGLDIETKVKIPERKHKKAKGVSADFIVIAEAKMSKEPFIPGDDDLH